MLYGLLVKVLLVKWLTIPELYFQSNANPIENTELAESDSIKQTLFKLYRNYILNKNKGTKSTKSQSWYIFTCFTFRNGINRRRGVGTARTRARDRSHHGSQRTAFTGIAGHRGGNWCQWARGLVKCGC